MVLKIDSDSVTLQSYRTENTSSKWRYKNFPFLSPSLSKILFALLKSTHFKHISTTNAALKQVFGILKSPGDSING